MKQDKQSAFGISSSTLKIIAIITMLIDHYGLLIYSLMPYYRYEVYQVFRLVGRTSFPIFCFLLVEGFRHTRNVWRYAGRLLIFALISEIPFDFALHQTYFYPGIQNVFFTLFLALLGLMAVEHWQVNLPDNIMKRTVVIMLLCVAGYVLKVDYKGYGVLYMILLYVAGNYGKLWMEGVGIIGYAREITAPLAFIPIHFYNGERGIRLKYVFYIIYPAHLLVFGIIRRYLLAQW